MRIYNITYNLDRFEPAIKNRLYIDLDHVLVVHAPKFFTHRNRNDTYGFAIEMAFKDHNTTVSIPCQYLEDCQKVEVVKHIDKVFEDFMNAWRGGPEEV